MKNKKTIMIAFGGISPEHEVSVITGLQVLNNIDKEKYDVVPTYMSKKGQLYISDTFYSADTFKDLQKITQETSEAFISTVPNRTMYIKSKGLFSKDKKIKIDAAFLCFHGGFGESGQFQGLLDIADIPYVGSGVLGSAIGMDKVVMKQVLNQNNISVAPYVYFYKSDWEKAKDKLINKITESLGLPLFIKPANSGSSIGITKVANKEDLENAIDVAFAFDRKVIIEKGIEGFKEVNISVIGIAGEELITSEIEEVFTSSDFLNYEDKYVGEEGNSKGMASTKRKLPADISSEQRKLIREKALQAFTVLNSSGLARIDFLLSDNSSEYFLIEINTIPGSMSFYLWEAAGLKFKDMIDKLLVLAEQRHSLDSAKTTSFTSNLLSDFKSSLKGPKNS